MADALISRELLRMCLDEFLKLTEKTRNEQGAGLMVYAMDGAESAIRSLRDKLDNFPTVDAVPVVHAKWEHTKNGDTCSSCGCGMVAHFLNASIPMQLSHCAYCHNCGAKMDLVEDADG